MAHEAYYNSEGQEIPSVTQILKILNKKGLLEWANYLGIRRMKYKNVLDEKALLGTLVHKRIECDIANERYSMFFDPRLENEVLRRYNLYEAWKNEHGVEPLHSELRLHNDRYGGTIDFIGNVDGVLCIGDFKTSKKPQFTHMMQLGAYLNLVKVQNPDIFQSIQKARVICFPEKGSYIEMVCDKDKMIEYQEAFEKLYHAFISLEAISKRDWKVSLI